MSRLNDLLRQLRLKDSALADDLQREVDALADRRSFGLNFERHVPEAVELPGRKVRRGDKVRILPPRGIMPTTADERLWRVLGVSSGQASLEAMDGDDPRDTASASINDLIVVTEFRDPIYPGLVSTGKVEHGGGKPFHTVIKAENYHALQTLLFTHRGTVDCIYIDPPYNTGNEGWIYNDRYVADDDHYKHSKWLAFMERRLLLARELLTATGVIIVAVGDDEHHRLRLLLDQTFEPDNFISDVVWQGGRKNDSRYVSNGADYMLVYAKDESALQGKGVRWREKKAGVDEALAAAANIWEEADGNHKLAVERWRNWVKQLKRSGSSSDAVTRFVNLDSQGRPIRTDADLRSPSPRPNLQYDLLHPTTGRAVRMHPNGWRYARETMDLMIGRGLIYFGPDDTTGAGGVSYLDSMDSQVPESVFVRDRNSSGRQLMDLLGEKRFPNPKDVVTLKRWISLAAHKSAVILDFFGGSGTTIEAVMRLNEEDDGTRACILITNNEVAAGDAVALRRDGYRAGDAAWEAKGVHDFVTKPRLTTVVTGDRPDGSIYNDTVDANVEFFTLTYETPLRVASHREFERIAPLLWLRAGSAGRRIDDIKAGWDVAEAYGVLDDLDQVDAFLHAMKEQEDALLAFVVTDEDRLFESVCRDLPVHVEPVRLYESYLRNFEIEAGRGSR